VYQWTGEVIGSALKVTFRPSRFDGILLLSVRFSEGYTGNVNRKVQSVLPALSLEQG